MNLVSYRKTVVGWYNFTLAGVLKFNVDPVTFREITGVSEDAALGTCELTSEELTALREQSKYIGLEDGWEWVPNEDAEEVAL